MSSPLNYPIKRILAILFIIPGLQISQAQSVPLLLSNKAEIHQEILSGSNSFVLVSHDFEIRRDLEKAFTRSISEQFQERGYTVLSGPDKECSCHLMFLDLIKGPRESALVYFNIYSCIMEEAYSNDVYVADARVITRENVSNITNLLLQPLFDSGTTYNPLNSVVERSNKNFPRPANQRVITEELARFILSSKSSLHPVEGIWQTHPDRIGDTEVYFKIFIFSTDDKPDEYGAVVIDSDLPQWESGDLIARMKLLSNSTSFACSYRLIDKQLRFLSADIIDGIVLHFNLNEADHDKFYAETFVKTFPIDGITPLYRDKSVLSTGTGFFVHESGLIVTNNHVLGTAHRAIITVNYSQGDKQIYGGTVVLRDIEHDLALIKIDNDTFREPESLPVGFSEEPMRIGTSVYTLGFPLNHVLGSEPKLSVGIISSETGINDDPNHYQISVPIQPGNSGGLLFTDMGYIAGVTTAKLNENYVGTKVENINYAIKEDLLQQFLMNYNTSHFTWIPPFLSGGFLYDRLDLVRAQEFKIPATTELLERAKLFTVLITVVKE